MGYSLPVSFWRILAKEKRRHLNKCTTAEEKIVCRKNSLGLFRHWISHSWTWRSIRVFSANDENNRLKEINISLTHPLQAGERNCGRWSATWQLQCNCQDLTTKQKNTLMAVNCIPLCSFSQSVLIIAVAPWWWHYV